MQQEHRKAIQSNFVSLVEGTDLDLMVSALYEKGVFSETMIEPYKDTSVSQRNRKRKMYMDIMRRGPHAFEHLLEVLHENGYWDLVRDLDPNSMLHPFSRSNGNTSTRAGPAMPSRRVEDPDENSFLSISAEKIKSRVKMETRKTSSSTMSSSNNNNTNNVSNNTNNVSNNNAVDTTTAIPHFHVKKSTKFMEDSNGDIKLYKTRGKQRGVLLALSYIKFDANIEKYRKGVDVDCNNLKYLFDEFGFKPLLYQDLTKQETIDTLKSLKQVLTAEVESVFVVISSHGHHVTGSSDNDIRCSDGGLISLYKFIDYFNNRNLPQLADVPKVFIFQICRGANLDYVWQSTSRPPPHLQMPQGAPGPVTRPVTSPRPSTVSTDGDARAFGDVDHDALAQKPVYSNILIAHSTLPGFVSHRDEKLGSWYIQAICDVFAEYAHNHDVDDLFKLVDVKLQERFKIQTSSVDRWGFNKRLYLHPGLYE